VISGGEVTLRPWQPADTVFVFYGWQDDDVQRWCDVPRPVTALAAARYVNRPLGAEASFAITRTDTGEVLGSISLHGVEVSLWVGPDARHQGVATNAVRAVLAWARDDLGLSELRMVVAPANEEAFRMAERTGFRRSEAVDERGVVLVRRLGS
jgi:RimJ/RimL family protein N-acetyltransferase